MSKIADKISGTHVAYGNEENGYDTNPALGR